MFVKCSMLHQYIDLKRCSGQDLWLGSFIFYSNFLRMTRLHLVWMCLVWCCDWRDYPSHFESKHIWTRCIPPSIYLMDLFPSRKEQNIQIKASQSDSSAQICYQRYYKWNHSDLEGGIVNVLQSTTKLQPKPVRDRTTDFDSCYLLRC